MMSEISYVDKRKRNTVNLMVRREKIEGRVEREEKRSEKGKQ
jgi:hypothetical protein